MKKIYAVWALFVCLPSFAAAERVRTVVPRATLNYLSIPVAEVKSFFRDQGLENETIVIPGSTAIAALVSGNVDYSGAGGTGMRAALRGAPIKAIMFQTEKVTWYLLAAPEIQKISDLRGKRVAVVNGDRDPMATAAHTATLTQQLKNRGAEVTVISHPDGHTIDPHTLPALAKFVQNEAVD